MGKIGLTKEAALQNLSRNPQQLLSKMQAAIDPRILRQMGGAGNMMNILREVSKQGSKSVGHSLSFGFAFLLFVCFLRAFPIHF